MYEIPEDFQLTFTVTGRDIKTGIASRCKKLQKDLEKLEAKLRLEITHPKLDEILEDRDLTVILYPTKYPADDEESDEGETWKMNLSLTNSDSFKKEMVEAIQVDKYHLIKQHIEILETIERNVDVSSSYEVSTTQLVLFGL